MKSLFTSPPDNNIFRILISTDNHLGYNENDGIRNHDSFRTFEEIFKIGINNNVDYVLLGGDVFHENKPSRLCIYKCMEILNKYCLGNKPINFELLSDPKVNFPDRGIVNYDEENINIALPIFSIHGNHDDPSGIGGKSPMHLLSSSKLVNYFGNALDPNEIEISPIIMQKGKTKLALYGLGALKDARLHHTFLSNKVTFLRPVEDQDSIFNMFVLHQNRVEHSSIYKNVIPESILPKFLDLVFWGHEHECIMELKQSASGGFFVLQPGSSVVTALMPAEAKPKSCGILEINEDKCRLLSVPLKTIRPFLIEDTILADVEDLKDSLQDTDSIDAYLSKKVDEMINQGLDQTRFPLPEDHDPILDPNARLPLIRLRVDYTGSIVINPSRFGSKYVGKVANPSDILLFHKKKSAKDKEKMPINAQYDECFDFRQPSDNNVQSIQDILKTHLPGSGILPDHVFANALQTFVEKHENDAIEDFVNLTLSNIQKDLYNNKKNELDDIREFVLNKTLEANENIANIQMDSKNILSVNDNKPAAKVVKSRVKKVKKEDSDNDDNESISKIAKPAARGRKPTKKKVVDSDDEDDIDSVVQEIESVSDVEMVDNSKKRKLPEIESEDSDSTLKKKPKVARKKAETKVAAVKAPVRRAAALKVNDSIDLTEADEKPVVVSNQRKLPFSIVPAAIKKK